MPFFFRLIQRISRQKPQLFQNRYMGIMTVGNRFANPANAPKVRRMNPSERPLNFGHEPGPISYPAGSVVDFQRFLSPRLLHLTRSGTPDISI